MTSHELAVMTIEGLVEHVREGRDVDECFEELVVRFRELLTGFVMKRVRNFEDSRDIVQQTWIRAFQRIGRPTRAGIGTAW